jgi:hypothetical protein
MQPFTAPRDYRKGALPGAPKRSLAMSRTLIILGLILVAAGVLWPWISWLRLGRLPGDIIVERQNFTLYVPITTAILFSLLLTLFLWLFNR